MTGRDPDRVAREHNTATLLLLASEQLQPHPMSGCHDHEIAELPIYRFMRGLSHPPFQFDLLVFLYY